MLVNYGNREEDDAYWDLKEWDYYKQNGTTDGYSKYSNFYDAVQTGRNLKAVISDYTTHGVEAKTLASQITSYFKPLYKEMSNSERASIKGYLLNAYVQLGYSRAEKNKDINAWLKDKD
jgi:putative alpha-1,2-mannosidase